LNQIPVGGKIDRGEESKSRRCLPAAICCFSIPFSEALSKHTIKSLLSANMMRAAFILVLICVLGAVNAFGEWLLRARARSHRFHCNPLTFFLPPSFLNYYCSPRGHQGLLAHAAEHERQGGSQEGIANAPRVSLKSRPDPTVNPRAPLLLLPCRRSGLPCLSPMISLLATSCLWRWMASPSWWLPTLTARFLPSPIAAPILALPSRTEGTTRSLSLAAAPHCIFLAPLIIYTNPFHSMNIKAG
jgi:hypothetical protein